MSRRARINAADRSTSLRQAVSLARTCSTRSRNSTLVPLSIAAPTAARQANATLSPVSGAFRRIAARASGMKRWTGIMLARIAPPGQATGRSAFQREQDGGLAASGDFSVEVLHDQRGARRHRVDLFPSQRSLDRLGHGVSGQSAKALEQRTFGSRHLFGLQQLASGPESARVIDQPQLPVLRPQDIPLVAVAVLDQLVPHAHDMRLLRGTLGIRP